MKLKQLTRLKIDSTGRIPIDLLIALNLPMPRDVLVQFVWDHGTKAEFQTQYGEVDLHAIRWECLLFAAHDLLACSIYPDFVNWVEIVADRTRSVGQTGWEKVILPKGAADYGQLHRTWMRPPVMINGSIVGSSSELHLVEGHTRLGALRGLVESAVIAASSLHQVWLGSQA